MHTLLRRNYPWIIIGLSLIIRWFFLDKYNLFVEEAYYWNYAQHLDLGYLDHPPMVALLIKCSTMLFGNHEWSVRLGAMTCWLVATYYSYQLSQAIHPKSGLYAVLLLSILPFFFLHSLVLTPDLPLMAAWSAALYYLYQALVGQQANAWFAVGTAMGLGMLSKYSIGLLALATLYYLLANRDARFWFKRREPYLAALIGLLLFSPVIYWNATHDWVSFAFQSTRRLQAHRHFSLHVLVGLCLLFLTPIGIRSTWQLFQHKAPQQPLIYQQALRFMQCYLAVPLLFFAYVSLTHTIKFNWIGTSLLAVIPWLALGLLHAEQWLEQSWQTTAAVLLIAYIFIFTCICLGPPKQALAPALSKNIAWENFAQTLNQTAVNWAKQYHQDVLIMPLDPYHTSSELAFYQQKLYQAGKITTMIPTKGADLFGIDSLMYRYWNHTEPTDNRLLMIISNQIHLFQNPSIAEKVTFKTPLLTITAYTQGRHLPVGQYYYRLAVIKTAADAPKDMS